MLRYVIFFSLVFIIFLSSCASPPMPKAQADIQATVAPWGLGAAELSAMFYAATEAPVVAGSVNQTGQFELNLQATVAADLLELVPACEALSVSNVNAKMNQFSGLVVTKEGAKAGLLAKASSSAVVTDGVRNAGDYYVQFIYADQAVSLKGDCPLAGVPGVFRYDLDLKAGWNEAAFSLLSSVQGVQTLEMSSVVPAAAAWFYRE